MKMNTQEAKQQTDDGAKDRILFLNQNWSTPMPDDALNKEPSDCRQPGSNKKSLGASSLNNKVKPSEKSPFQELRSNIDSKTPGSITTLRHL